MITNEYDLSRKEWEQLINDWILNETHRKIICRRLLDKKTYEQLAEEFDLSVTRIKYIIKKCTLKLRQKMTKNDT